MPRNQPWADGPGWYVTGRWRWESRSKDDTVWPMVPPQNGAKGPNHLSLGRPWNASRRRHRVLALAHEWAERVCVNLGTRFPSGTSFTPLDHFELAVSGTGFKVM